LASLAAKTVDANERAMANRQDASEIKGVFPGQDLSGT
jgi:hypothetical protein